MRSPRRALQAREIRPPVCDVSPRSSEACGTLDHGRSAVCPLEVLEQGHRAVPLLGTYKSLQQMFFFRLISHFFLRRGFQKLKAAHLASRRFRFGFGRKFGRYITELDLSRLCIGSGETDPTVILDALPSLPNLRTVVTPLMSAVADAVVIGIEHDNGGRPDPQRTRPEVSFVTDGFLELFASVPSLVVYVLAGEMNVLDRLATRTPQTRQLVLYDHEDAELSAIIDVALVAIRSLPLLSELKLVTAADFIDDDDDDDDDAVRRFVVPPECHLRHLVLSAYAEFAAPLYELVGKLSPFLRSLELSAERFGHNVAVHERFLDNFHFPQLETLIVTTGDSAELGDLAVSLSPTRFPVLRRLELRVRSPANPPAEVFATTTDVVAAFASRPLPPLTVVADSVSTDFRRLQIDTSPLPAVDQTDHHRHSLVPSILLCDPFSRGYSWLSAEDQDLARHSRQTLEPLLDQVREMIHEAVKLDDCVQLRRVAHALQPCELLRIERNA